MSNEDIKQETTRTEAPQTVHHIMSSEDETIQRLLQEQEDLKFPALGTKLEYEEFHSMFELPKSCKEEGKHYAFVFCEATDRMLRKYQAAGWQVCSRTKCSWIPDSEFAASGAVERHGHTRHVLLFMPRYLKNKIEKQQGMDYKRLLRSVDKKDDPRFYKSGEGDEPIGSQQVQAVTDHTGSAEALNIPPGELGSEVDFIED